MIGDDLFPWLMLGYVVVAMIGGFICLLWILAIAFSEGVLHGLGCLLCGPYGLYYCVTRWRQCMKPFLISLALNIGLFFVNFQRAICADSVSRRVKKLIRTNSSLTILSSTDCSWRCSATFVVSSIRWGGRDGQDLWGPA